MPDPTLASLDARLAVVEAKLGLSTPTPPPVGQAFAPATPTGLRLVTLADGRLQLDWDASPDASSWDVLDLLDTVTPVKETVTAPRSIRSALKPGTKRCYVVRARNAIGVSPNTAPLAVPVAPAPPPPPSVGPTPGGVLNLSRWYLTLPIADPTGGDSSGPWDVYQPALATFTQAAYFRAGTDTLGPYVEYVAPTKGVSTSGSGAARCELRETAGPAPSDKANWSFADGKAHTLTVTLACDGTSIVGRKEAIVGQIHGPGGTPPLILCVNHTRGALEVFRQGPRQGDLLTDLTPGELITYRVNVGGGRLKVWACRGTLANLPAAPGFDWDASVLTETSGLYFKAGAYNKQEISTATTGAATVRHYRLDLI